MARHRLAPELLDPYAEYKKMPGMFSLTNIYVHYGGHAIRGRGGLRKEYFRERFFFLSTPIGPLLGIIHGVGAFTVLSGMLYKGNPVAVILGLVLLNGHRTGRFLVCYRTLIFIGGTLPLFIFGLPHYLDIGQTQLGRPTDQYLACYTYSGTHGHEMEERVLVLLTIRNLTLGI